MYLPRETCTVYSRLLQTRRRRAVEARVRQLRCSARVRPPCLPIQDVNTFRSQNAQHFSPGFWCRVFHEILLPVFDGGRAKELSNDLSNDSTPQDGSDHDQDRWLFQTCQHCLDGVVDLFAKFYPSVATKAGEEGAGVLRKLTALLASLGTYWTFPKSASLFADCPPVITHSHGPKD